MKRTDGDAFVTITSAATDPVNGFGEGDPTVPAQPSQVKADFLNNVQEELASILDEAGIALDGTVFDQVLRAIKFLTVTTRDYGTQDIDGPKTFQGGGSNVQFGALAANPPTFNLGLWMADDIASPTASNEITNRAVHKAHCTLKLNTSTAPAVAATDKYNIGTVSASGGGTKQVIVPFAHAFATSSLPSVVITAQTTGGGGMLVPCITGLSVNSVSFQLFDSTGTAQDPTGAGLNNVLVCVTAEGKQ